MNRMIPYLIAPLGPFLISVIMIGRSSGKFGIVALVYIAYSYAFTILSCLILRMIERIAKQDNNMLFILYGTVLGWLQGIAIKLIEGAVSIRAFMEACFIFALLGLTASIFFVVVRQLQIKEAQQARSGNLQYSRARTEDT